jgi:hypothetical protein
VERGLVWCVTAGQARFVGVWCGAARIGSLRQVRHGAASSRKVRLVPVRQAGWGEVSSGEVG